MKKEISIISVTKDDLSGLERTYSSLRSQQLSISQWERIEWVVIDGDSFADPKETFSKFILPCEIKWSSEPDHGIFDAMNKGIAKSSGRYAYFLNSGDRLHSPEVLALVLSLIAKGPADVLHAGKVLMNWRTFSVSSDLAPWVCHQAVVVPVDLLRDYRFNPARRFFGDLELWMRLSKDNKFKVVRHQEIFCIFDLGGIGNCPECIFQRLDERARLAREYGAPRAQILRAANSWAQYLCWKVFGRDAYYRINTSAGVALSKLMRNWR